ncbi:MAG: cysteine peptidase family C39 domain-containing protein [Pseudobdellovibrionaceae bacterium]|nr:cysteine peptidase family C39 domain-containing protein [Pseudobdellovibrionaceae bacterium]
MKDICKILAWACLFSCSANPGSSLKDDSAIIVALEEYLPDSIFDSIPDDVDIREFVPFRYAMPDCGGSNCQIALPDGTVMWSSDLLALFNLFDGKINIDGFLTQPLEEVPSNPWCIGCPPSPSGPGTGSPPGDNTPPSGGSGNEPEAGNYNPVLVDISEQTNEYVKNRLDRLNNLINAPWPGIIPGTFDIAPTSVSVTTDYIDASTQKLYNEEMAKNKSAIESIQNYSAKIQGDVQNAALGAAMQFNNIFSNYQKARNDFKDRADKASSTSQNLIKGTDLSPAQQKLTDLMGRADRAQKARNDLASEIMEDLPPIDLPSNEKGFKTDPSTVEGQAVRRAQAYVDYSKGVVSSYPLTYQGRVAADQMLADSVAALRVADSQYAKNVRSMGEAALNATYALADAALALAPIALLSTGPVGVTVAIGIEALNIAKSWYEYRTGKRLWNGEKLTPFEQQMAMLNVGLGMVPASALLGKSIVGAAKPYVELAKDLLAFGRPAEEAAITGKALQGVEKVLDGLDPRSIDGLDVKVFREEVEATYGGRFSTTEFKNGKLGRDTSRTILLQGEGTVTCGPNSCGMVLDTQGRLVRVDELLTKIELSTDGSTGPQLVNLFAEYGVGARRSTSTFPKDLESLTSNGRPVIAQVMNPDSSRHWLVVDGVTTRQGQKVVAIRDPGFGAYFQLWEDFIAIYTREAIIPTK